MASLLEAEGVRVVDAEIALKRRPARIHDGWQLKIYALMESAFAEALLLDADQVPVVDPAAIFDWPEYRARGAVFWRDLVDISEGNPIWSACNLPSRRHPGFDSGQVLVDKRRHWQALEATLHLNEEADTYYRMVYGDKDTFLAGWLLARHDYALVESAPFADLRCRIQRDFAGAPLFQHRCEAKWSYRGEQRRIAGFVHHEACLEALAELRRQWNGRIFHPPGRGLAAREIEARLAALCSSTWSSRASPTAQSSSCRTMKSARAEMPTGRTGTCSMTRNRRSWSWWVAPATNQHFAMRSLCALAR